MTRLITLTVALAMALAADGTIRGQQRPVFRTGTQAVSVDVSVRSGNVPVNGLTSADFRLFDNGTVQKITALTVESVPIDVTLFLDTSPSTAGHHQALKADVRTIASMLRPDDRFRLLTFDTQIGDVFGWRAPGGDLPVEAIGVAQISPVCDGLAAALLRRPAPDRRHLVVGLTDGIDYNSVLGCRTLKTLAPRAEAVLHVVLVGYSPSLPRNGANPPARGIMLDLDGFESIEDAARSTGGQLHDTVKLFSRRDTVAAFKRAFDLFRESYCCGSRRKASRRADGTS